MKYLKAHEVLKKFTSLLLFSLFVLATAAQQKTAPVIRITGTRLTYPLVQKWIDEYMRLHPTQTFELRSGIAIDSADILIVSHQLSADDVKENQAAFAVSRYVQLPIINNRRSDATAIQAKGFREADFVQAYFMDSNRTSFSAAPFTVYKREKPACASQAFANHFGSAQSGIKGIGVLGDDKDLLNAVKRDATGLSYNNLGFIYDLHTRKPIDSIAIIPIDLNENGTIDAGENFYGTLDSVLAFAEKDGSGKLLVENVNVIVKATQPREDVVAFLKWVLARGQSYNHAFGFLTLDATALQNSQRTIAALRKSTNENSLSKTK